MSGEKGHAYRFLYGKLKKRGHWEDLGIDGRTIRK
jgi:hypothetical protein